MHAHSQDAAVTELFLPPTEASLLKLKADLREKGLIVAIAGPDGAGKSSLANALERVIISQGLSVQRLHIHQWRRNLLETPKLLRQANLENKVVILDRSFQDNVAELVRKLKLPIPIFRFGLWLSRPFTRHIDAHLVVLAPFKMLLERRPEEDPQRIRELSEIYAQMAKTRWSTALQSDQKTLQYAIEEIGRSLEKQR